MFNSMLCKVLHDPDIVGDHEITITHKDEDFEIQHTVAVLWITLLSQLSIMYDNPIPALKRMVKHEEKYIQSLSKE